MKKKIKKRKKVFARAFKNFYQCKNKLIKNFIIKY